MWKDTDIYSKRDDDSAIGDSENNSAEEESMNSRRKSSISDDIDEESVDPQSHLENKVGTKIPKCLLKSSQEMLENCHQNHKIIDNDNVKLKREIKVLPNAAAASTGKQPNSGNRKSLSQDNAALDFKFQVLISEMKKLRDLDQDILKKFIELNESVEEVRCRLAENEENLRRKLEEEDEEDMISTISLEYSGDVIQTPSNYENIIISANYKANVTDISMDASAVLSTPIVSSSKSLKVNNATDLSLSNKNQSSSTNSNHATTVDIHIPTTDQVMKQQTTVTEKDTHMPHPQEHKTRLLSSEVWVVREEFKSSTPEPQKSKKLYQNVLDQSYARANSEMTRRRSEVIQPFPRSRTNLGACSFRMVTDENSRIGRHNHWAVSESQGDKVPAPRRQSFSQHHVVELSRTSKSVSNAVPRSAVTKASDSSGSLNSSSSMTSSESTSSVTTPSQNSVKRSNSSKWSKLFQRRFSKSSFMPESKKSDLILNNNYRQFASVPQYLSGHTALEQHNVSPLSYKRASPTNTTRWTHHQDDITYL